MKVLMLSGDPKLSDQKSGVSLRISTYSSMAEKIYIVVSADGNDYQLAQNVFVYFAGKGLPIFRKGQIVKKMEEVIKSEGLTNKDTIITAQDPFDLGRAGIELKNKFGFKLEMQIHGDIFSPWFKKQSFLHSYRVSRAPQILEKADRVRVVSSQIKESLTGKVGADKVYILPIAVDKWVMGNKFFLPQKFPGLGLIILTVARLEKEKNVEQSIRLLKNLLIIEPRTGLVIVGDGSRRKSLEKLSEKLGVRANVLFEGWTDKPKDYFASCHLYLQTSYFEGYGMAIAEAALAGKAILSTDVGVAHDLAKLQAASVVPVEDDEKLFESAKGLLDQEKRTIMGIAAERMIPSLVISTEKYMQIQKEEWNKTLNQ